MNEQKDFALVIAESCLFLKERLKKFKPESNFYSSIVEVTADKEINSNNKIIRGVVAVREDLTAKLGRLKDCGCPPSSIENIFPSRTSTGVFYFLIGKIYFTASQTMLGEIDFLQKYLGNALNEEFLTCSYQIKDGDASHFLLEKTTDWENGIRIIGRSISEYETNPQVFIKERILRWKVSGIPREQE